MLFVFCKYHPIDRNVSVVKVLLNETSNKTSNALHKHEKIGHKNDTPKEVQ
jgi:hypothetical protein